MNLFVCEHPLRVYNKYTRTYETVPCGKCNVCRNRRSASWVDRLEIERKAHKYCVFFTLTYSEEFVPKVVLSDNGCSLVNPVLEKFILSPNFIFMMMICRILLIISVPPLVVCYGYFLYSAFY